MMQVQPQHNPYLHTAAMHLCISWRSSTDMMCITAH